MNNEYYITNLPSGKKKLYHLEKYLGVYKDEQECNIVINKHKLKKAIDALNYQKEELL